LSAHVYVVRLVRVRRLSEILREKSIATHIH
jgi:hypothetical protein